MQSLHRYLLPYPSEFFKVKRTPASSPSGGDSGGPPDRPPPSPPTADALPLAVARAGAREKKPAPPCEEGDGGTSPVVCASSYPALLCARGSLVVAGGGRRRPADPGCPRPDPAPAVPDLPGAADAHGGPHLHGLHGFESDCMPASCVCGCSGTRGPRRRRQGPPHERPWIRAARGRSGGPRGRGRVALCGA
jgi:hypothetical protein